MIRIAKKGDEKPKKNEKEDSKDSKDPKDSKKGGFKPFGKKDDAPKETTKDKPKDSPKPPAFPPKKAAEPTEEPKEPETPAKTPETPEASPHRVGQMAAGYKGSELGPFECQNCAHWLADNACEIVDGPIDPFGICSVFESAAEEEIAEESAEVPEEDPVSAEGY